MISVMVRVIECIPHAASASQMPAACLQLDVLTHQHPVIV